MDIAPTRHRHPGHGHSTDAKGPGAGTTADQPDPTLRSDGRPGHAGEQRLHRGPGPDAGGRGRRAGRLLRRRSRPWSAIGFVALAFLGGLAVPLYLAGWLLIPDEDTDLSVAEELLARERAHGAF